MFFIYILYITAMDLFRFIQTFSFLYYRQDFHRTYHYGYLLKSRNSCSMVASVLLIHELPFYGGVRVAHSGTPVLWWRPCCSFIKFSELFICLFVCFLYCFVVVCLSCSLLVMCSTLPMTMSILDGPFGFP